MQKQLRWRWQREQTFWWPEHRFLVKAKECGQRWAACEPRSSGTNYFKESSDDDINKGVIYANWNDWSWKDGGKYGAATSERRSSVCGLRQVAKSRARVGRGKGGWLLIARRLCAEANKAAGGAVDGSGGRRGRGDGGP